MEFYETIKNRARSNIKKIIIPEATRCGRVLKASKIVVDEDFAKIIFIGNVEEIRNIALEKNIDIDLSRFEIIDPKESELTNNLASKLHSLRQHKGMTIEEAYELIYDPIYFGTMLLETGYGDGLVAGTTVPTSDVLRPALQIIRTRHDARFVSSFFLLEFKENNIVKDDVLLFADAGINENPNSEELAEITIQSVKTFDSLLLKEPRVALLSYSTKGSAKSEMTQKIIDAYNIVKERMPNLIIDGEIQADAALVPHVAERKIPNSPLEGNANILIFPDLNSGNISYKLVQRLANAKAYGPMCQGLNKPVNDLSRGAEIDDIVGTIALTAIQAQEQ